jgi:hypothetical protein
MVHLSKKAVKPGLAALLAAIVFWGLGQCTASNYGRLSSNPEVTRSFEAYQILPDHNYYYRGTFGRPVAVVGIHRDYQLDSKLWIEIDPRSNDFKRLVDRVSLQGSGNIANPWGFDILDKSGNEVGVWYSAVRAAAVDIDENGRIVNLSPIGAVAFGNQER